MASRKEYDMMFQLNAQLGGSYNSTFKSAQSAIAAMQKEIEQLSRSQADISAYQKQQAAIEATKKKLEVLQQQYDNIQKEMSETEGYSSALENKLLSKQQQIDKTSSSISAQTEKLGQMGAALRSAGIDTDKLEKESAELGAKLDEVKKKQEEAADKANNFGAAASKAFGTVHEAIVAAGIAKALKEIYEYFMSCADASMTFESVMTGVDKTTELTNQELAAMGAAFKELSSKEIPATTDELGAIAETAGQLGIAKDDLLDFTKIMAMLGTATNMTSDEAATMLAQFASITGMDPSFYDELGATIVDLGNNYATTEKNITDMSQSIAAAGAIAGMSEADIVGISAAVTSLGITAQNGATQMSKLISDINSAVSSGEDLDAWAAVARMSAEDFSAAWGSNAAGALDLFITGLNETYRSGQDVYGVLSDLGITETRMVTMMTSLAKSGDRLTSTLKTANEAWSENTALTTEAEKRYNTTQSQLVMKENAYANLTVAIGDAYTPVLKEAYKAEADIMNGMAQFIAENPTLVRAVTAAAIVLGTATAALAVYTVGAKLAAIASAALTAAIPGVNVIMAVTAGVALLAAGITALASATGQEEEELRRLTASSREQYYELQQLNAEYETAKEQYGATSDEALALRYQVDELNASYEASKQTLEEFVAETDALLESHSKIISSYSDASAAISNEEQGTLALVYKLEELSKKTSLTTVEQEQMKAAVDALNESIPDLALNYDNVSHSLNMSAESLKKMVKAQAEQERQTENYRAWVDLTKEELALSEQLAQAQENLRLRREELTSEGWNVDAPLIGWSTDLDDYTDEVERLQVAYDENQAALEGVTAQAEEYAAAQENVADGSKELNDAISDVTTRMEELTAAYNEAYDAALESVQGQYDLWDKAAKVVATDADTIKQALESQVSYWQDYNTNLASLSERSGDIEGLSDVIASFADGSEDSVNAIAGMAKASDDDLKAMVESWKTLQEEQKIVAESLAELETNFTTAMDNLQTELETTVAEMNLGQEAAQSGINTMQGFINGATDMLPQVEAAYSKVAQAAVDALNKKLQINSPSRVLFESGEYSMAGFVGGVEAMEPEVAAAMKEAAGAGIGSFAEEQAQLVMFAPQLMAALSAMGGETNALRANGGGYGGIQIDIRQENTISGITDPAQLEPALAANAQGLREMVYEAIEDIGLEAARRRY